MRVTTKLIAYIKLLVLASFASAQKQDDSTPTPSTEVIVNGVHDIVVNGRARVCRPLLNDPVDKVPVRAVGEKPRQSEVTRIGDGRYVFRESDEDTVTGPDFWTRAGTGLDQYTFRTPVDGRPLCIGAHAPDLHTWGQLRKIVDARPYWGKRVRFTLWVATGQARLVRFWLVSAGHGGFRGYRGANTNSRPFSGDHGWTPVMLEMGPVSPHDDHISYGFLLLGGGTVWAYKPELTVVNDEAEASRKGIQLFIGNDERITRAQH